MQVSPPKTRVSAKLRERITFERQSDETDDYGNVLGEFAPISGLEGIPADVREVPGKEVVASGAVQSTRMATIRVRYSAATAGVTAADRIIARGETWNIRSGPVQVDRAPRILEFLCEAGVAT